jgi:hypothetical protein
VTALRNIAIIAAAAFVVAFFPGGERAGETVMAAILIAFLTAIGFFVVRAIRSNETTIWTMDDGRRALFWGAIGVLVLCVVAMDEAFRSGGTFVLWLAAAGLATFTLIRVWMQARDFA